MGKLGKFIFPSANIIVRAKALKLQAKHKAFALTGRLADCHHTKGVALGYELLGLQPVLEPYAKLQ